MTCVNGLPPFDPHGQSGELVELRAERDRLLLQLKQEQKENSNAIDGWVHDQARVIKERDAAILQINEIKRRIKGTLEMAIEPCCKRLLQAAHDGIDNIAIAENGKDETLTFSGCGHVLKAKDALCPICGV